MDKLGLRDEVLVVGIERAAPPKALIPLKGRWKLQICNPDGSVRYEEDVTNQVVDEGANSILGIMFHGDTQITTWYVGIVDNASFSAFSNSDTMGSHAGWIEFTNYSEANRVTWSPGASSGRAITNGTAFQFTIAGSGTLKGIFVTSNNTKSGTSGKLWSVAAFGSLQTVNTSDLVKLVYTVSV